MMPTIRVEDDVFEGLKSIAEPFVDSPSSVIRRLLVEKGILKVDPAKASPREVSVRSPRRVFASGSKSNEGLTPQHVYESYLLSTLFTKFDGRGDKRSVTKAVIERLVAQGFIGPRDLELVATGETKAENTIAWGRNVLKDQGLISRMSPRGIWELTEEGRVAAQSVPLPKPTKR